jgi:hypothetical protein
MRTPDASRRCAIDDRPTDLRAVSRKYLLGRVGLDGDSRLGHGKQHSTVQRDGTHRMTGAPIDRRFALA